MKHNFDIQLAAIFGEEVPLERLQHARTSLKMRHAKRSYFRAPPSEAILQEFDGRYGYLYSMEFDLQQQLSIPILTEQSDLHILYLMTGAAPLQLMTSDHNMICTLPPERACYLYLPAGSFFLHLPSGKSNLFGFYFDGGIFRDGNEIEFPFLADVLTHYRASHRQSIASIDFWVGPRTRSAISYFCRYLQRRAFSNEKFVFDALCDLITLSIEKVEMTAPYDYKLGYVTAARERIAVSIRDGNGVPSFKLLAADIGISIDYLTKLHRSLHKNTLQKYAQELVLKEACDLLRTGNTPTYVSYHLGFGSPSDFGRFFKEQTQKTPAEWAKEHKT